MTSDSRWWAESWNPVTGCTPISESCQNCYAERMARRLAGRCGYPAAPDHFKVTLHPDRLDEPLRWRKPRRVFVCSMGDLFHEDVPDQWLARVFEVMQEASKHTFMVLTKRPERMKEWVLGRWGYPPEQPGLTGGLPENIWLGVTAETQARADERIPVLLEIPAAVRFVSVEPMLGEVNVRPWLPCTWDGIGTCPQCGEEQGMVFPALRDGHRPALDWVICGGETGPGARPMHLEWVGGLRDQCAEAGVPFFFKAWGEWAPCEVAQWIPGALVRSHRRVENMRDPMYHVGRKAAGRLLDGQEHNEWPR